MATSQAMLDHLLDVLAPAGTLAARRMFGEAALYLDGKLVALVCNDLLYVKPTPGARAALPGLPEAPPYPGARPHLQATGLLDDPEPLVAALRAVAADLPAPKPKKARR